MSSTHYVLFKHILSVDDIPDRNEYPAMVVDDLSEQELDLLKESLAREYPSDSDSYYGHTFRVVSELDLRGTPVELIRLRTRWAELQPYLDNSSLAENQEKWIRQSVKVNGTAMRVAEQIRASRALLGVEPPPAKTGQGKGNGGKAAPLRQPALVTDPDLAREAGSMATDQSELHAAILKLLGLYQDATDGWPWPHHHIYGEKGWEREGEGERDNTVRKRGEMWSRVDEAQRHLLKVAARAKFDVPNSWLTVKWNGGLSLVTVFQDGGPDGEWMHEWEEYAPDLDALEVVIAEMGAAEKRVEAARGEAIENPPETRAVADDPQPTAAPPALTDVTISDGDSSARGPASGSVDFDGQPEEAKQPKVADHKPPTWADGPPTLEERTSGRWKYGPLPAIDKPATTIDAIARWLDVSEPTLRKHNGKRTWYIYQDTKGFRVYCSDAKLFNEAENRAKAEAEERKGNERKRKETKGKSFS